MSSKLISGVYTYRRHLVNAYGCIDFSNYSGVLSDICIDVYRCIAVLRDRCVYMTCVVGRAVCLGSIKVNIIIII